MQKKAALASVPPMRSTEGPSSDISRRSTGFASSCTSTGQTLSPTFCQSRVTPKVALGHAAGDAPGVDAHVGGARPTGGCPPCFCAEQTYAGAHEADHHRPNAD